METLVEDMMEEITLAQEVFFAPQELSLLDQARIPRHVAIAMDGNRRWAKKRFLPAVNQNSNNWKQNKRKPPMKNKDRRNKY